MGTPRSAHHENLRKGGEWGKGRKKGRWFHFFHFVVSSLLFYPVYAFRFALRSAAVNKKQQDTLVRKGAKRGYEGGKTKKGGQGRGRESLQGLTKVGDGGGK
eukprot:Hpha_TRINITY_DN16321_c3_g1::TRINITY_DN16321_c3_g1_i6::g.57817::m.57817